MSSGDEALKKIVETTTAIKSLKTIRLQGPITPELNAWLMLSADPVTKAAARRRAAKSGVALPDGSFPIPDKAHVKKAIRAIGRAKNPARAKAHIKKRARALGASSMIPDSW
jgi:hypothetical protein